jgi:hypothetical protein
MPIRRSPNGAGHTRPHPGRDQSESVVAINRNQWSRSVGTRRRGPVAVNAQEEWPGERDYFAGLVQKLELRRELLGRNPGGSCIEFYEAACHKDWKL